MNELSTGWRIFRVGCALQLAAVALELVLAVVALMNHGFSIYNFLYLLCFLGMLLFLLQGFSMLNNNFPDTPLTRQQKSRFNWFFLINFLCIAILFAQFLTTWRGIVPAIFSDHEKSNIFYVTAGFALFLPLYLFVFHIIFLVGMYRLRRMIFKNTIERWDEQFGSQK